MKKRRKNKNQENNTALIILIAVFVGMLLLLLVATTVTKDEVYNELENEGYYTETDDAFYKKVLTNNSLHPEEYELAIRQGLYPYFLKRKDGAGTIRNIQTRKELSQHLLYKVVFP